MALTIKNLATALETAYKRYPELFVDHRGSVFDYPEYGGLPKNISSKLSTDCVDVIQYCLGDFSCGNKKKVPEFEKYLRDYKLHGYQIII